MKNSASVLDADLSYAVRMVDGGFNTPEQAAAVCGVSLLELQTQLRTRIKPQSSHYPHRAH